MSTYVKILSINVLCGNNYTLRDSYVEQLKTNYQSLLGFVNPVMKNDISDENGYTIKLMSPVDYFDLEGNTNPWKIDVGTITVPFGTDVTDNTVFDNVQLTLTNILTASSFIPIGTFSHTSLNLGILSLDGTLVSIGLSDINEYVETVLSTVEEHFK